jgi:rRNA maturation protein Nop10
MVSALVVVNDPALLLASNSGPVCAGNSINLQATCAMVNQFIWTGPLGYSSTNAFSTLSNTNRTMTGNYSVTVMIPGCGNVTSTTYLVVNDPADSLHIVGNTPLCSSQNLQLSVQAYQNAIYNWTAPNGLTSGVRNAIFTNVDSTHSGIYSLSVTVPGCGVYSALSDTITVISVQRLNASSNSPVCEGGVIYLNAVNIPGASYLWTGPNGFSASVQGVGIPQSTLAHSGLYSLTSNIPGCNGLSDTVRVVVSPDIRQVTASSNSPLCSNATLVLSSSFIQGATFNWQGPNGFTGSSTSVSRGAMTLSDAGVYTLSVSSPACPTSYIYLPVTVSQIVSPVPVSNSPVCTNSLLALSVQPIANTTFLWTSPSGATFSGREWTFSARLNDAGIYTLTTTTIGCGPAQVNLPVTVNPPVHQNQQVWTNSPVCSGNLLAMSLPSHAVALYSWSGPNGFTANSNSPVITAASTSNAGAYSVSISVPGCGSANYIMNVKVTQQPSILATSNSPVCENDAIFLNASSLQPLYSGTWTGPNGYSAAGNSTGIPNATLLRSGVYTFTSIAPGCGSVSATTNVVVNGGIQNVLAWANGPLCTGQSLVLSATVVSGASYLWQGPGGFSANTSQVTRNLVNPSMAGTYSLYVSQAGCGGARLLMVSVNIFNTSAPTASIVSSPACVGNAVYLNSTNVSGATSYQWTGPLGYVANIQNPSISNIQMNRSGVYTLTVAHPSCGVFTATASLIVNPAVNNYSVVTSTPGCIGSTLSLSSTIPSGGTVTHFWRAPNGTTFNTPGITIVNAQVADAGTYTYTVNSPACGTNTRRLRYVVNDPSLVTAANNGPLCIGGSANLNATGISGTAYSWSGPAGFSSSAQFATRTNVQLSHAGDYTLNATVPGCGVITRTTTLVVNSCRTAENSSPDGIAETDGAEYSEIDPVVNKENQEKLSSLQVYPNPFHEELSLSWSDMKVFSVKLYDLSGKLVYEAEPKDEGTQYVVKAADLPNGVYLLMVQTSAGPVSYRITRL